MRLFTWQQEFDGTQPLVPIEERQATVEEFKDYVDLVLSSVARARNHDLGHVIACRTHMTAGARPINITISYSEHDIRRPKIGLSGYVGTVGGLVEVSHEYTSHNMPDRLGVYRFDRHQEPTLSMSTLRGTDPADAAIQAVANRNLEAEMGFNDQPIGHREYTELMAIVQRAGR